MRDGGVDCELSKIIGAEGEKRRRIMARTHWAVGGVCLPSDGKAGLSIQRGQWRRKANVQKKVGDAAAWSARSPAERRGE